MEGSGPLAPGLTALPARADGLRGFTARFASGSQTSVLVGRGAINALPALCKEAGLGGASGFLCDANVYLLHKPALDALGAAFGGVLARPVREERKSLAEVEAMCDCLAGRGVARDGHVIALGGGVLTDLAGLAAALYQRGVPWVSAPTTLLSQVDAGFGGKTGANLRGGKNLVGAFHHPRLVVCDADVLSTLPVRERWSGLAEVVKCALIAPALDTAGTPFLERCERSLEQAAAGDGEALAPLVEAALRLKAEVVCADEHEGEQRPGATWLRAFLNLGHTAGHALEAATHYTRYTHGEAVALGLKATIALSQERGLFSAPDAARARSLVQRLQVAAQGPLSPAERAAALGAMAKDKKARAGKVRFVFLRSGEKPLLDAASAEEQSRALDAALA
jgi:3-dehydroquinate synthetase